MRFTDRHPVLCIKIFMREFSLKISTFMREFLPQMMTFMREFSLQVLHGASSDSSLSARRVAGTNSKKRS